MIPSRCRSSPGRRTSGCSAVTLWPSRLTGTVRARWAARLRAVRAPRMAADRRRDAHAGHGQGAEPGDRAAGWRLAAGPPRPAEMLADLEFAWRACRSVKSNAILLAAGQASVGIGMGQVNRVDAARLAVTQGRRPRGRGGRGQRCVLPVRRRPAGPGRRRGACHRRAGRIGPRRGGDRRGEHGRRDPVLHRRPALLALSPAAAAVPRGRLGEGLGSRAATMSSACRGAGPSPGLSRTRNGGRPE